MRLAMILQSALVALWAVPIGAASLTDDVAQRMRRADIVLLGEIHDNPEHHIIQAEAIELLQPKAVVWEMLTDETAARINAGALDDPDNLDAVIKWATAHWPNFDLYRPVLMASDGRSQFGGLVPRSSARSVMDLGAGVAFGSGSAAYGLMIPLAPAQQSVREAQQQEAHCNAMPPDLLPKLVEIQRLRDATLARAAVRAFEETGGPVVIITGNGHARKDWGVPVYLKRVNAGLRIFSLGQSEDGSVRGIFDAVHDSPVVERPDPCAVFEKTDTE